MKIFWSGWPLSDLKRFSNCTCTAKLHEVNIRILGFNSQFLFIWNVYIWVRKRSDFGIKYSFNQPRNHQLVKENKCAMSNHLYENLRKSNVRLKSTLSQCIETKDILFYKTSVKAYCVIYMDMSYSFIVSSEWQNTSHLFTFIAYIYFIKEIFIHHFIASAEMPNTYDSLRILVVNLWY